jgi:predicted dehydrogenase
MYRQNDDCKTELSGPPLAPSGEAATTIRRRDFLGSMTAIGLASALSPIRSTWADEPNDDIRVAVIGLRGRGGGHIEAFRQHVVALCDVDQRVLNGWKERLAEGDDPLRVDTFTDFRRLLERNDIDAISIATPNHTHALIAIMAAQAGKHVYVEKPASQTVWEGQQLAKAAKRFQRVIQCGTQTRSSSSLQAARKFVHDGGLGAIQYAHGTCYKRRPSIGKLNQPLTIPDYIDFDLWCGPTAKRAIYRPQLHYDWHWDFATGNGDLGNQGIHQMDVARWFLGESQVAPRTMSLGGRLGYEDAGNTPNTLLVWHDYPRAPLLFEVRGLPTAAGKEEMDSHRGMQIGVIVQCEKGHVLLPSYTEAIAFDREGQELQHWRGGSDQEHYDNFLRAVSAGDAKLLNAEVTEGHRSSALCHLGNISYQVGQATPVEGISESVDGQDLLADAFHRMVQHLAANGIEQRELNLTVGPWLAVDVETESIPGNEAAQQLLHRQDREPFQVPTV